MTGSKMAAGIVIAGVAVALVLAAGSSIAPLAQTRDPASIESQPQEREQTQELRDLVAEVRAPRGVIENYTAGME